MAELKAVVALYQDLSKEWSKGAGRNLDKVTFSLHWVGIGFFKKWISGLLF